MSIYGGNKSADIYGEVYMEENKDRINYIYTPPNLILALGCALGFCPIYCAYAGEYLFIFIFCCCWWF